MYLLTWRFSRPDIIYETKVIYSRFWLFCISAMRYVKNRSRIRIWRRTIAGYGLKCVFNRLGIGQALKWPWLICRSQVGSCLSTAMYCFTAINTLTWMLSDWTVQSYQLNWADRFVARQMTTGQTAIGKSTLGHMSRLRCTQSNISVVATVSSGRPMN